MRRFLSPLTLLCSVLLVSGGNAQSPAVAQEKPVWSLELMQVKAGMFGPTMGYLDDHWMLVREEAKRRGLVLAYHRISDENSFSKDSPTIVLLTEFKNQATCDSRDALFGAIEASLPNNTSGIVPRPGSRELYNLLNTRIFRDYSDSPATRLELLAGQ
jgi:hypothetical protein